MSETITPNVDSAEVQKFDGMAARWWDINGEFRPLHDLNPVRLRFIQQHADIAGKQVLDIGCGGGILSESMAYAGAKVTGIDAAQEALTVARRHAMEAGIKVDYQQQTAEDHAVEHIDQYDFITCLELLEHVPDPARMVKTCALLVKPGGRIFFSTINRNPKAYALAVIGAEYIMHLLPKGTHDYNKFIKPSELARWARRVQLTLIAQAGMRYNPIIRGASLTRSVDVNYLMCFERPLDD